MKQDTSFLFRRLNLLFISSVFLLFQIRSSYSHSVWKDETDWGGGDWGKHVGPPRRGPHFLPGLPFNVSVTVGRTATLPCQVANLRGRSVSWIRQSDLQVLTTNKNVFTSDDRFKVIARRFNGVWAWDLDLDDPTEEDGGVYECQINTRPKLSHPVLLQVIQAGAVIAGPPEVYVNTGSRLLLTCWVHAPPKPPGPLIWIHNGSVLDSLTPRGGLSLHVAVEGARASTRLSLLHVTPKDAGNYTCQPEGLDAATAIVFVLQDEAPAAMHHDNSCPILYRNFESSTLLLCLLVSTCVICNSFAGVINFSDVFSDIYKLKNIYQYGNHFQHFIFHIFNHLFLFGFAFFICKTSLVLLRKSSYIISKVNTGIQAAMNNLRVKWTGTVS